MKTICVVITARPSYSRVKTVLDAIKEHQDLELQLVVAGSALLDRYGNSVDFIESDGFEVNEKVFMVLEGENPTSMAKTTGLGIMELSTAFFNLQPDAVVTIADRFETIATSIAASYQNIPLIHLQGGEVTGNIDEKVRHANTKLADVHFVCSEDAKHRVCKMGEDPDFVFNTGCPSIDLAAGILGSPELDFQPFDKYGGVGPALDLSDGYLVVMQHPVTTEYEASRFNIEQTLEAVHQINRPTLWFWPNVDAGADGTSSGIRAYRERCNPDHIHFFKNMEPMDFLRLLYNSDGLIGNSSVGIRECAFLGVPVVNIGTRQHRRQRAENVIDCSYTPSEIVGAYNEHQARGRPVASEVYGEGDAGRKIANLLADLELKFHKTICY